MGNFSNSQSLNLAFLSHGTLGVGVDGGNDKDWEANACKIQLIKKKGKVKALDEEVHSNVLRLIFVPQTLLSFFYPLHQIVTSLGVCVLRLIFRIMILKKSKRGKKSGVLLSELVLVYVSCKSAHGCQQRLLAQYTACTARQMCESAAAAEPPLQPSQVLRLIGPTCCLLHFRQWGTCVCSQSACCLVGRWCAFLSLGHRVSRDLQGFQKHGQMV